MFDWLTGKASLKAKAAHVREQVATSIAASPFSGQPVDLVISPNEISFAHGTGVLLSRLLEGKTDLIAVRSRDDYGGSQRLTTDETYRLSKGNASRAGVFSEVMGWLGHTKIRRIICAPYFETDLQLAIAAQAYTGAPLGLWIMDDNCVRNTGIAREIMVEALDRSTARFAISPELRRVYESEFRKPFAVIPPLVSPNMVRSEPSKAPETEAHQCVMIGNLWSGKILDQLSQTISDAGLSVTWYCENPDLWSGQISQSDLLARGITLVSDKSPEEVQAAVTGASAVLLPSDPGDVGAHETALGDMSLPTRLPFIMATSGTPVIVLAREGTAAGNFVSGFEIGEVIPYDSAMLKTTFEKVSATAYQIQVRENAARIGPRFSFDGALEFIEATIDAKGRWPDERYQSLFPPVENQYALFAEKPAPPQFSDHFADIIGVCDRLKFIGFEPDWILDIGASTAVWSRAVETVFDNSRYILCDPMFSRYEQVWAEPHYELVEAAIGNQEGEITFSVSSDLYGSSIIQVSGIVDTVEKLTVPMRTVDSLAREKRIEGRGLMKVDVQFAEHLVIDGALELLADNTDVVILELTLPRVNKDAKTLLEMCNRMEELGFRVFDVGGGWRVPSTGELEQADLVFVRHGLDGTLESLDAA